MTATPSRARPEVKVHSPSHLSDIRVDQSSSSPQRPDHTQELLLLKEWKNLSTNFAERGRWRTCLEKKYGQHYVECFYEWLVKYLSRGREDFATISDEEFLTYLGQANWKENNDALGKAAARLWRNYVSIKPEYCLGYYNNNRLSLRLNGRALGYQETELEICELYNIMAINPDPFYGIRYKMLNSSEDGDFLFVPLGNVYSAPLQNPTGKLYWHNTDFVLLLEILNSGEPGDFYLLYNSANQDYDIGVEASEASEVTEEASGMTEEASRVTGEASGITEEASGVTEEASGVTEEASGVTEEASGVTEVVPRFCNGEASFTLAKLDSDFEIKPLKRLSRGIHPEPLCMLKPEVVETGLKGNWSDGCPPIPLFTPSGTGQ